MQVRTRFAPSPTGFLHVGGARTALFCWLYARRFGGSFVLRIEDTDRERSTQQAVDAILDSMEWLALEWDEGPHYQTQRFDRYAEVIDEMLADGRAYRCYCSRERLEALRAEQMAKKIKPRYDGRCRDLDGPPPEGVKPVIRFRNPDDGEVVFDDLIRGTLRFSNQELDDLVIARPDGTPTYNFTVVVDDREMDITHVIRGDDHINNTPRQINILRALGAEPPSYAHVPMILGPDGQRLSKRHGAVSVTQYREDGFLPEALLNYLVRLGWSHGDQEVFTREEMVELFDLADVNRAAATFDTEKLAWLNHHWIKQADTSRLAGLLATALRSRGLDLDAGPSLDALVEAQRERSQTIAQMADLSEVYFADFEHYDEAAARKHLTPASGAALAALRASLASLPEWQPQALHEAVSRVSEETGLKMGKVAQPLRVAVCGRAASPSIEVTLALAGRDRTLARLERALAYVSGDAA